MTESERPAEWESIYWFTSAAATLTLPVFQQDIVVVSVDSLAFAATTQGWMLLARNLSISQVAASGDGVKGEVLGVGAGTVSSPVFLFRRVAAGTQLYLSSFAGSHNFLNFYYLLS